MPSTKHKSMIARPSAVTQEAKQRSIFEPGDIEKMKSKRNIATNEQQQQQHFPTANPGDSYRTSMYANRAAFMGGGGDCSGDGSGVPLRQGSLRRSSFCSTSDIGKDRTMTKKEKFFLAQKMNLARGFEKTRDGLEKLFHMDTSNHPDDDDDDDDNETRQQRQQQQQRRRQQQQQQQQQQRQKSAEFGREDEDSCRLFNLRHLFTSDEADPYASTYQRHDSTNDNKGGIGNAINLLLVGTAVAHNR